MLTAILSVQWTTYMLPTFHEVHNTTDFMHDKVPCYTTHKVKQWLQNKEEKALEWSGNFPDLNPIENA